MVHSWVIFKCFCKFLLYHFINHCATGSCQEITATKFCHNTANKSMERILFSTALFPTILNSKVTDSFISKFTKQPCKFLAFFNAVLIKNFAKFIKGVLRIAVQTCNVLFLVFFIADFNFAFRNRCLGCAFGFIFGRHTNIRHYAFFVIICAVINIYVYAGTACFVFSFVLNIFIGKRAGRKFIVFSVVTGNNTALKVSVILNINIKAFVSSVNAALVSNACIITVDIAFAVTTSNTYFARAKVIIQT